MTSETQRRVWDNNTKQYNNRNYFNLQLKTANVSDDVLIEEFQEENRCEKSIHFDPAINEYLIHLLGEESVSGFIWDVNKHPSDLSNEISVSSGLVNIRKINDIRRINKYLEAVNQKLETGEHLVITIETMTSRKKRLMNKFPAFFNKGYYLLDFILKRVFPKWKPTRKLYFWLTEGRNRVISLTEGLARLVCCGFEIVDFKKIGNLTYIVSKKVKEPAYDMQPTYGALIRLKRVGQGGKLMSVYKFRTMYPYSEYLQTYIFEKHNLKEEGKFNDDFRMTSWGRLFRKYWIDELPMLINWLKGEMKLVGVRPLSGQYYELYPRELQELRNKNKPGLVPPYYADMPKGLPQIQQSELIYLTAYEKNPIITDIRYFFKAFVNIIFKGARSQ